MNMLVCSFCIIGLFGSQNILILSGSIKEMQRLDQKATDCRVMPNIMQMPIKDCVVSLYVVAMDDLISLARSDIVTFYIYDTRDIEKYDKAICINKKYDIYYTQHGIPTCRFHIQFQPTEYFFEQLPEIE